MKKQEAANLKKGTHVYYHGYEWIVHGTHPYYRGKDWDECLSKQEANNPTGYNIVMKAIDGNFYPICGDAAPRFLHLDKQYWLGVEADHKKVTLK